MAPYDCHTFNNVREWFISQEPFINEKINKSHIYNQSAMLAGFEAYHMSLYGKTGVGAEWCAGVVFTLTSRSRLSKTSKHIRNVYKQHGISLRQTKRRFGEPSNELVYTFCIDGAEWYNLRNSYIGYKMQHGPQMLYGWRITQGYLPEFWGNDLVY